MSGGSLLDDSLARIQVKPFSALPPLKRKVLVCRTNHIATWQSGQITDDRGFYVDLGLGHEFSLDLFETSEPQASSIATRTISVATMVSV